MVNLEKPLACAGPCRTSNRFDSREWAGAFGDLGTLIPFVMAYVTLLSMDPFGVLFSFGAAKIACGLYYRTPFPVQPMKASGVIATTGFSGGPPIMPEMVYGAGLATGALWLLLGLSGTMKRLAGLVSQPVAIGILLGVGMSFMLQGLGMMAKHWVVSAMGLTITTSLLICKRSLAMPMLLLFGALAAFYQTPSLVADLSNVRLSLHLPAWQLGHMTTSQLLIGTALICLPQVPLTLSNAVIAVTAENNNLFSDRPVNEKTVALSTGVMNSLAPWVGGVPMCHGAGGMAGHVAFGARTGGSMIILGSILLFLALFLADSLRLLFRLFPDPILGVILLIAGWQLSQSWRSSATGGRRALIVTLVTALLGIWNIAVAFACGIALFHFLARMNERPGA